MPVQLVNIEILGASFSVQTDETREYMETLLGELERRLDALKAATRVADPLKLSILANITLLDELARARKEAQASVVQAEFEKVAERLIVELGAALDGEDAAEDGASGVAVSPA